MVGVLSLLWLIPFVGALIVWGLGTSQRAATFIGLGFSLVEMVLATSLLLAMINPGWAFVLGAPTATPPPTGPPFVPLFYMERFGGWKDYGFNYIVGVDGLSVPLIWLTALLTTLAIVFHWDEEQRPRAFFGLFMFLEMALVGVFQALDFILFAVFWELVLLPMFFLIGIWGGPNRRYAALKFLIFTHVGFVIMLLSMFTLYWTASASVNAAVYGVNAPTLDMTAFLHGALRHATGSGIVYLTLGAQIPILAASSLTVIGVQGGIFQLFNHGIITAILFMLAGSVKHSTGTRDIPELQGLARVMPQFSLILAIGFFASLGLPGLNSFWSEFMVFVGAYGSPNLDPNRRLILIRLLSIVVTAAYYLYTMQRILFGDPPEKLAKAHDLLPWERISYAVLVALVFLVGLFPLPFLAMINAYTSGSFPWLGGL